MGERYFNNPYYEVQSESSSNAEILTPELVTRIKDFISERLKRIDRVMDSEMKRKDVSAYTGTSGIAYLLLEVYRRKAVYDHGRYLELARRLTEKNDSRLNKRISLLCGDPGSLLIRREILLCSESNDDACSRILNKVIAMSSMAIEDPSLPDEYLYGRSGYLGALCHFLNQEWSIRNGDLVDSICAAIIANGRRGRSTFPAEDSDAPALYYAWHGKEYIGAAHGYAGILYYLLKHTHCASVEEALEGDVKQTVYWLLSQQYPGGNFPSSVGSSGGDKLMHWCHGAPGLVYTMIEAYKVFGDEAFKRSALACGEAVWERGVLRKGFGVCHGIAGNAYTHIALYKLTNHLTHLHRAVCMAELCLRDELRHPEADRPFSLFEGLAGTVYFLMDMLDVEKARFPLYELP